MVKSLREVDVIGDLDREPAWDIRPLRPEEVDVVGAVLGLARLPQASGRYLVAWADGTPLGHVHVAFTEPPELQDLEVRPRHRRLGVGTALISAAENEARARGSDEIRLEVSVRNAAVQALYAACGYSDAGLPIRHVQGQVVLRTGPIEVDDDLRVLTKRLSG